MNTVKLTKKTAYGLISRICHGLNVRKDETGPDATIYRARTDDLEIICENDWFDRNGLIKLTISDGGNQIVQYFSPNTLERDYTAEQAYKDDLERERRAEWVSRVGREQAHKMVDRYWEEG